MILLGILGSYCVVSFSAWCLCRMLAVSDKMVESRASVIPFKRAS